MYPIKVSVDFDSTLTKSCIQRFCSILIKKGIEVHITTSRCSGFRYGFGECDNSDLYEIAEQVGIEPWNIHFTNGNFKSDYLSKDFLFHLDDNEHELERIAHIPAIDINDSFSLQKCYDLIREEFKKRGLI